MKAVYSVSYIHLMNIRYNKGSFQDCFSHLASEYDIGLENKQQKQEAAVE